jgi:hypothetical protein
MAFLLTRNGTKSGAGLSKLFGGFFMIPKKRFTSQVSADNRRSPFWVKDARTSGLAFEEKALAVFQPDVLVSSQYLATYQRKHYLDPERLLMLAVLEDAVVCFQDNIAATCSRKRALYRDAEQWILDGDRSYLFSFENVCETLGYNASYLRQGLVRWKEEALASLSEKEPREGRPPRHKNRSYRLIPQNRANLVRITGTV